MAKLVAKGGGQRRYIPNIAPDGVFVARCIDILETYNVEEEEYGKPGSMVTRDKMTILFSAKTLDGTESYLVQTKEFNISGSPKSNIVDLSNPGWAKPHHQLLILTNSSVKLLNFQLCKRPAHAGQSMPKLVPYRC